MGIIISFANQKGGVGKTTSAINIAAALGVKGKKVLLCDMDPQSNTTSGVGIMKRRLDNTIYNVLIGTCETKAAILPTAFKNLSILPADINLAGGEIELIENETFAEETNENSTDGFQTPQKSNSSRETEGINKFFRLKTRLKEVDEEYDYILIDCPPSLGILTLNSLIASNYVVVPMQCEFFALEGLSQLTQTIKIVKKLYNPALEIGGILVTMYDGRLNLSIQVMEELKRYFPDKIFKTPIPRAVRLSEAPSHGTPIYYYDRMSKSSDSYLEAANEILTLK